MIRRLSNLIAVTIVMALGGIIGYVNSPNDQLHAQVAPIQLVDVSKSNKAIPGLINIDLNKEQVSVSGNTENATINIQKEIVKVPVYVEKKVNVPVYEHDLIWGTKVFKAIAPLTLPKINADRN